MRSIVFLTFLWVTIAFAIPGATSAVGQVPDRVEGRPGTFGDDVIASGTSYHVFVQPGEATMQVTILGDIAGTGIYLVGRDTDLGKLFALAGGTPGAGRSGDVRRDVSVRLLRDTGGSRSVVYEAALDEMLRQPGAYPSLQNGDVFVVDVTETRRLRWTEALRVVSSLSSIVLLIDRISRL